jgi:hypothetical protein
MGTDINLGHTWVDVFLGHSLYWWVSTGHVSSNCDSMCNSYEVWKLEWFQVDFGTM